MPRRRLTTRSTARKASAPKRITRPRAIRLVRELAPHTDGAPDEVLDIVTGPFERRHATGE